MNKEVVIYTTATCPFCIRAKKLLEGEGIEYTEIDITNKQDKLDELETVTNCSTVPQIFVEDKFIGGCDDIVALHKKGNFHEIFK